MPTNDFKPFAADPGATVIDQATYAANPVVGTGFQAGIADELYCNKAWRQSSVMAYIIAQFSVNSTGLDMLDDGDLAVLLTRFTAAVNASGALRPSRLVTVSALLNIVATDYALGLARVAAPAAMNAQIPDVAGGLAVGQEFVIEDIVGNLAAYPVTVLPPAGMTLAGRANYLMNEDRQSARFRYYGANQFSVAAS